ncbi:THAP domain-containing protein 11 [Plakobranchus ocellatus]|uniref:THAP domain-containing protein 11 n=1 Tax=Plakobranchus ocellatus TaxID=259542 RepID=A0AAV4CGS7_9GAST|nr:THAP domain-containing protein 11 [Plakobranchus ocellatus]
MPRKCCVPNCKGNYSETEKVSVFHFPADEERKRLWCKKIPRADFQPTSQSVVCEKHFDENFIIRIDKAVRPDGTILSVKRDRPKLTADAFPSIFPMCPSYLSSSVATKRKAPDDRRNEQLKRDNESFFNWIEADKIRDFEQFSNFFKERVDNNVWLYKLCCFEETTGPLQCWSIYKLMDFVDSGPRLSCTIRIFSDLHVEIFTEKNGKYIIIIFDTMT